MAKKKYEIIEDATRESLREAYKEYLVQLPGTALQCKKIREQFKEKYKEDIEDERESDY